MIKSKIYRFIYKYFMPFVPDNHLGIYFKWKVAIRLVGTEFHQNNLAINSTKLNLHFCTDTPLQEELINLLDRIEAHDNPNVLDIGAGPISKVGKIYRNNPIKLTAIDPVAYRYSKLLKDLKLVPPIETQYGVGEELSKQFPPNTFDLIHARNAIDHTNNPFKVINEALQVLKTGGYIYLNHYINEGMAAIYYGLHQWNFFMKDDKFFISGKKQQARCVNVNIHPGACIETIKYEKNRIIVVIKKLF